MTSIMTNSYFLFVCAIVTAQGLRHRFSLNKTEEGSPRHSKFLNLFSVVRWEAVINIWSRKNVDCMKRVSGSQIPGAAPTEALTAPAIVKQSAGKGRVWWQVSYFLCLPSPLDKSIIFVEIKKLPTLPKGGCAGGFGVCCLFHASCGQVWTER